MQYVAVVFKGSKATYTYKTDLNLQIEDMCVVHTHSGYHLVSVVETASTVEQFYSDHFRSFCNLPEEKITKWIVDKVDTEKYEARVKKEEQRKQTLARLDAKLERISTLQKYELLRKLDPEADELLKELELESEIGLIE